MDDLITQYALDILDRQDTLGARLTAPWPGEHRLELAQQQKSLLQEQWYAEEISDALYFSQLTSEEAELKRLVNEQKVWTAGQQSVRHPHMDARTAWNRTSLREKREILSGLLDSVTILPGTKGSHRFEPATVVPVWRDLGSPSLGG
ncbi:hypothetical protein O1Q96_04205 [Streptomyces sp. Qhu-G9]|uniref:hypothetical protein n=1 Tax=Streptomyces sp. Qhu-G9 TaxID=3452799 RepID=UPI0022AC5E95|nr:hypothetical protein [Streptomyces aurantiacus]WAU79023.1 hypothetical protein O1Q96_04205 [Streptomyces aurantiacus]